MIFLMTSSCYIVVDIHWLLRACANNIPVSHYSCIPLSIPVFFSVFLYSSRYSCLSWWHPLATLLSTFTDCSGYVPEIFLYSSRYSCLSWWHPLATLLLTFTDCSGYVPEIFLSLLMTSSCYIVVNIHWMLWVCARNIPVSRYSCLSWWHPLATLLSTFTDCSGYVPEIFLSLGIPLGIHLGISLGIHLGIPVSLGGFLLLHCSWHSPTCLGTCQEYSCLSVSWLSSVPWKLDIVRSLW